MGERQRCERVVPAHAGRSDGAASLGSVSARANSSAASGRGRQRQPRRVAEIVRAAREPRRQPRQAAEEPQAAADLGEHRIGRRERRPPA